MAEHHSERPPVQRPEHSNARPLTYAEGTTLHFGEQSVTMPRKVVEIPTTTASSAPIKNAMRYASSYFDRNCVEINPHTITANPAISPTVSM